MPRSSSLLGLAAAAFALPLVLAGCSSPSSAEPAAAASGDTITVKSAYGEVQLPKNPERVAGISYDTPWQLMSLDVKPVATIDYSQWEDSYNAEQLAWIADAKPVGTFGEVNFEALTAAKPDVIVGDAFEVDESTFKRLQQIAPTVIVSGKERGDWVGITEETATALGKHDVWEANKESYEKVRDAAKEKYADVIADNSWINFSLGDGPGQYSVQLPTGATGNLVVNEMGMKYGKNVPLEDTRGGGYVSFPEERLGEMFNGVTVALTFKDQSGTFYPDIQKIVEGPLFKELAVSKSGNVYGLVQQVTDHRTAELWVNEVTSQVLEPLTR